MIRPRLAALLNAALLVAVIAVLLPLIAKASEVLVLSPKSLSRTIQVAKGRPQMIETNRPFTEIMVGDPKIADISPLTDQSFMVLGNQPGITGVVLLDADKNPVGQVDVEVSPHTDRLAAALAARLPGAKIDVSSANGNILLSGVADDPRAVDEAAEIAGQFAAEGTKIVNTVDVAGVKQVQLEVRFIEATRNAGRELGVNWQAAGGDLTGIVGRSALESGTAPFGSLIGNLVGGGVEIDLLIQALEQRGLARRLAEPNLVALSGDTASFLAGGEFPFPVAAEDGKITVEFKKFGVGLDFTPTVQRDDVIHLVIRPEVSQLDPTVSLKIGDITIPSITVRRATTTLELRDGQSFVIAGLLQANTVTSQSQVPWIGEVPVIGTLFRSSAYQKQETDLIIIVTPRLVRPLDPGQKVGTPLSAALPGNDVDFFLNGRSEVPPTGLLSYAAADGKAAGPATGHLLDFARAN